MSAHPPASPFHQGERDVQTRLGVRDRVEEIGQRFIRSYLPQQHREFYQQLPYLFIGSVDALGRPWASVVVGRLGFIQSPDAHRLHIAAPRINGDPLHTNIMPGSPVGVLGIQYETRRRNRLTAKVEAVERQALILKVDQTFGNCPQYIQAREPALLPGVDTVGEPRSKTSFPVLNDRAMQIIRRADNFYIATHYSDGGDDVTHGADVSHRGGRPGFVRVDNERTLTFPDFAGNRHFNTIGNLIMNPRAGLLFIDFESGDLVYLTCSAEIIWDSEEKRAFHGAERLVRFTLDEGQLIESALPVRWQFLDYSPNLEQLGAWEEVAETLAARKAANVQRNYTVTRVERESDVITSFYLEPDGDGPIPSHCAGQFLPIEIQPPGFESALKRTYTISNAPNGAYYRLSIKREPPAASGLPAGISSNYFHDQVKVGSTISALSPRGRFILEACSVRPIVLLSAGVGVTPMISMLEQLAAEAATCGCSRRVWFIHGARNGKQHGFRDHVRSIARNWSNLTTHFSYSEPETNDREGIDYDSSGRLDIELLSRLLPFDDYDFYLCGPRAFMESIYNGLKQRNVADSRIHYEFFGPGARLLRETPGASIGLIGDLDNREPVSVRFARSDKQSIWTPSRGTLLDLAEAEGLRPAYSCRSGSCSTCSTRLIAGDVAYVDPPLAEAESGHALICCAYPRNANGAAVVLDL